MLPTLTKIGVVIDFKINQDFIAAVLCINKEKPQSTCNGKCYLTKQLNKAEEQDNKQIPNSKKERVEIVLYHVKSDFELQKSTTTYRPKVKTTYHRENYNTVFLSPIFRPPKHDFI